MSDYNIYQHVIEYNPNPNPDFFPTTRAQQFRFFNLTDSNSFIDVNPIGHASVRHSACLASASYMRCIDSSCQSLTRNNVAQNVFSWEPFKQLWLEVGPGATGPRTGNNILTDYRPIVANGVKSLVHFSPDGVHDFIIPASFDEDLTQKVSAPTEQCIDVWMYAGLGSGWTKYQDCAWKGHGARDVAAFQINGEQYFVQANSVDRVYGTSIPKVLLSENYTQSSFVLKWSSRTSDNSYNSYLYGYFLTGGEYSEGQISESDPLYNSDAGNNGANAFQSFDGLKGAVDVEAFTIVDQVFIAFSEHVSNDACGPDGLGDGSATPSCHDYEIQSHIFVFNPDARNSHGDCPSGQTVTIPGCQSFSGQFVPLQTIYTKGARSMHYFTASTTSQTSHFLAVAEQHDNNFNSVNSSIYIWNGHDFGLFQRIETNFAASFSSFSVDHDTYLVVANRGCPEIERLSDDDALAMCDQHPTHGRARIWKYDPFKSVFTLLPETSDIGSLNAYGTNYQSADSTNLEAAFLGPNSIPQNIETYQLPSFSQQSGFGALTQYVAVSHHRVLETDESNVCSSADHAFCHHPASTFALNFNVAQGVTTQLNAVAQAATDNALSLIDLQTKIDGGAGILSSFNQ